MKGNTIEINGEMIQVEGAFEMELYSPFVDSTAIRMPSGSFVNPRGGYTLPFKSKDKKLDTLTNHADKLSSQGGVTTFDNIRILSNGITIDKGSVIVQNITRKFNARDKEYALTFLNSNAQYKNAINGLKLTGLQMDGIRTINNPSLPGRIIPGMALETIPEPVLYVPGTGSGTSSPLPASTDTLVTTICIEYLLAYLKDITGSLLWVALDQPAPGIMNLQVSVDLSAATGPSGYCIFANFTEGSFSAFSIQGITDYANTIIAGGDPNADDNGDYICFPMYGVMGDIAETDSCLGFLNYTNGLSNAMPAYITQEFDNITAGVKFINYVPCRNQVVPMFYYHQVLRHCFSEFGFTLQGDLLEDANFKKLILPNVYSILKEQVYQLNTLSTSNIFNALYCQLPTQLIPANHLPDMLISDFIADFMLRFQCYFDIDGTVATIKKLNLQLSSASFDDIGDDAIINYASDGNPGLSISYAIPSGDSSYAADTAKNLQNIVPAGPVNTPLTKSYNSFNNIPVNISYRKTAWTALENTLSMGIDYIPLHKVAYLPSSQVYKTLDTGILLPVNVFEVPSHPIKDSVSAGMVTAIINFYLAQIKKGNAQIDYFSAQPFFRQQYILQKDTGEIWTIINVLMQVLPSLQLNWNYAAIVTGLTSGPGGTSQSLVLGSLSTSGTITFPPQNLNNLMPFNTGSFKEGTSSKFQQFQLALTPVEMYEFGEQNWGTTQPFNVSASTFPSGYIGQSFNGTVYPGKPFPRLLQQSANYFMVGNIAWPCSSISGSGILAQLNINVYNDLGVPVYNPVGFYLGLSGNSPLITDNILDGKHGYVAYTGSKPSFSSLQIYAAQSLGLVNSWIDKSPDPSYTGPLGPGWPTGTYQGGPGALYICPTNLNTPPAFNAGDIESKIAIYHGWQTSMEIVFGYMSFHNYVPNSIPDGSAALTPWNLSLVGTEGLIATFWGPLVNVWMKDRMVTINKRLTWPQVQNWDWTKGLIVKGVKYYVASIKFPLPDMLNGKMCTLECYEI